MKQNMNMVLEGQDFDTANEFVAAYNKARLQNKNQWISYLGDVAGKWVRIKSYDTTNQILDVDGIKHGGTYDLSVAQWKAEILKAIDPVRRNPARRNVARNPEKRKFDDFNRPLDPIRLISSVLKNTHEQAVQKRNYQYV